MEKELPAYVLKQSLQRVFAQAIVKAILMLIALYYVIVLLFQMFAYQRTAALTFTVFMFLGLLFLTEMLLTLNKVRNTTYKVYSDKIEVETRKLVMVDLADVSMFSFKRNLFDRWFHTVTIILTPQVKLEALNDNNQFIFTLQKMIQRQKQEHVPHRKQSAQLTYAMAKPAKQ